MSFNGSGTFVVNSSGQPVVANTLITAAVFNAFTADVATGLSTAICKDGQTTITANIPFSGMKITGLGAGTARTDGASLATIQDGTGVYVATVGGTADAITLTPSPAITAYAAGQTFRFIASGANTTAVTVAVSGLTAKAITKNGTTALVANDILSGMMVQITYDGTRFILGTHLTADVVTLTGSQVLTNKTLTAPAISNPTFTSTTATGNGITMNTARLLGRTTASAGAIEEITVGASLTLSAGSLSGTASSETQAGVIELATQAEVNAATDTSRALYPNHNRSVLGTAWASTSGTANDWTGIPAGTRWITITFDGCSLSGTDDILVQLGDAGGIETSGYVSSGASYSGAGTGVANSTAGFIIRLQGATNLFTGIMTLALIDAATFAWASSHSGAISTSACASGGGSKSTSAELTRVRVTRSGTDTFDAGTVNILYGR